MKNKITTRQYKSSDAQYVEEPNDTQLARSFHLDKTDLAFIVGRRDEPIPVNIFWF